MSHASITGLPPGRAITLAEWARMPEDDPGEVVDGRLVEEEVPDYVHEVVVAWLLRVLGAWIVPRGGFVGGSEAKFVVRQRRGRKPDVSLFLPGGRKPPRRGLVRVPPDVAIEVLSPTPRDTRRDRVDKLADYAAFGVRWYWIVDPEVRSLEVFELGPEGRYVHALGATSGRIDAVPGCDGLTIDLDALWAETDRLGPDEPPGEPPDDVA